MRQLFGPILTKIRATIWQPAIRPYIVYALFMAVTFAGMARLDYRFFQRMDARWHLCLLISLAITLGILFIVFALPKHFPNLKSAAKTWLVIGGNAWGLLFFAVASPKVGWQNASPLYVQVFLPALISFSLPWLFWCAICAITVIPALRYLPLQVEHLRDVMAELRWAENKDKGIRWVFKDDFKEVSSSGQYHFQTYTPHKVEGNALEHLFKALLSLHNHNLNPLRPIVFETKEGLYGWEFHTPCRWSGQKRALNPFKTLKDNRLQFRPITKEEQPKSKENLSPRFRVATIYITRSLPTVVPIPEPGLWLERRGKLNFGKILKSKT